MKLLQIAVSKNDLYCNGFTFNLTTRDLVRKDKKAADTYVQALKIKPNLYTQNVIALTGTTATGKTIMLELIGCALHIISSYDRLNDPFVKSVLDKLTASTHEISISFTFCNTDDKDSLYIYRLDSIIRYDKTKSNYYYVDENLYSMPVTKFKTELGYEQIKAYSDHQKSTVARVNSKDDPFLLSDTSIVISLKRMSCNYVSNLSKINIRTPDLADYNKKDFIHCFDPSIDSLIIKKQASGYIAKASFKRGNSAEKESIHTLENLISSGTIKGISLLSLAVTTLEKGDYLLVDDIEDHLDKQFIIFILELFTNSNTNPYGASLIFTTHHLELLNVFQRKDNIYLTSSDDSNSLELTRFDINRVITDKNLKKSDLISYRLMAHYAPKSVSFIKAYKLIENLLGGNK